MKKVILTAVAVFAFGFTNAQSVKFGAKVGLNLATLSGDIDNASPKVGFHVGGFAEIMISDKFAIQPELLYSTQGAQSEFSSTNFGDSYTESIKLNFSYINLPIMAKFYPTKKFSIEAGPQVGFLVSAKQKGSYTEVNGGSVFSGSYNEDIDGLNNVDLGLNLGLGFNFTEKIGANLRYNLGLTDISKDSPNSSFQNRVLQLSFAYKF